MIRLVRERGVTVPKSLRGGLLLKKNLELVRNARNRQFPFNSDYWKAGKKQLKKESCDKCAYCEAPTAIVAHGDVEHFRPKKVYWWLAYCFENHLFACQICNQTYKSDKFPISGRRMAAPRLPAALTKSTLRDAALRLSFDSASKNTALEQFHRSARAEKALLADPCTWDPETFFAWEEDDDLKEVRLVARKDRRSRQVVHTAEDCLGLNREELLRARYRIFDKLNTFRRTLKERISKKLRDDVKRHICEMTKNDAEFAGMARFYVKKWKLKLDCPDTNK